MRSPENLRKPWKMALLAAFYVAIGLHAFLILGLAVVVYDSPAAERGCCLPVATDSAFGGTGCGYDPAVYCGKHGRLRPCRICSAILGRRLDQLDDRVPFVENNGHRKPDHLIPSRSPELNPDDYVPVTADLGWRPSFGVAPE